MQWLADKLLKIGPLDHISKYLDHCNIHQKKRLGDLQVEFLRALKFDCLTDLENVSLSTRYPKKYTDMVGSKDI